MIVFAQRISRKLDDLVTLIDFRFLKRDTVRNINRTFGINKISYFLRITWTSKASANQRAGRAGRVGPGHCYRYKIYFCFEKFQKNSHYKGHEIGNMVVKSGKLVKK